MSERCWEIFRKCGRWRAWPKERESAQSAELGGRGGAPTCGGWRLGQRGPLSGSGIEKKEGMCGDVNRLEIRWSGLPAWRPLFSLLSPGQERPCRRREREGGK